LLSCERPRRTDDPAPVLGIADIEAVAQSGDFGVGPQLAASMAMECAHLTGRTRLAQGAGDARFHLSRGLGGEGNGKNSMRPHTTPLDPVNDARHQRSRLAGTGACQHNYGAG